MVLILVAVVMAVFAFFYFQEAGLFRFFRTRRYEASVVDETEVEIFDNIGGTKTRFYKVYEYFDGKENRVVKSERYKRRIDNDIDRKCVIYVDEKNRKAMEKKDVVLFVAYGVVLVLFSTALILTYFYIKNNVKGAAL